MDATRRGKPGPLADTAGAALRSRDHREELRQHLISAGAGNLLDFELLEVLLLAGNPRGDLEPTAKALLHQFGSFAEVLNADTEALAAAGLDTAAIATLGLVHEATLRLMRAQLHARPVLDFVAATNCILQHGDFLQQCRAIPSAAARPQERADHGRATTARHGRPDCRLYPRGGQARARYWRLGLDSRCTTIPPATSLLPRPTSPPPVTSPRLPRRSA